MKNYEEPTILDVDDLEDVSGGGCGTGGSGSCGDVIIIDNDSMQ